MTSRPDASAFEYQAGTNHVIVTGGRGYTNRAEVFRWLDTTHRLRPIDLLKQGGASGADALARQWARDRGVECASYMAQWGPHGRAAGPLRNQEMADSGANLLIAFPGGKGTADMVRRAQAANIPVLVTDGAPTRQDETPEPNGMNTGERS